MNCLARERKDMRDLKRSGQEATHEVAGPDLMSDGIK